MKHTRTIPLFRKLAVSSRPQLAGNLLDSEQLSTPASSPDPLSVARRCRAFLEALSRIVANSTGNREPSSVWEVKVRV